MNLSNILKDPIDIPLLLLYVTGVLVMVYSAMQFVHYFIYKSKTHLHSGIKTLILALVLLAPRLTYQQIRIDGSDYKKSVKEALGSVTKVYEASDREAAEKAQLEALSERLQAYGFTVELDTSVETKKNLSFTVRNLTAVKAAASGSPESDFILISTVLPGAESSDSHHSEYAGAANVSALEALASKLKDMTSDTELRFLVTCDGRDGQDGAYNYIKNLSEDEKRRCLGNISFDLLGLSDYTGFAISTVNGVANPLSLSVKTSVKKMTGQKTSVQQKKNSQIVSFHVNGIHSVNLSQSYVDKAEPAKSPEKLNESEIEDMAAIIGNILMPVMKEGDSELVIESKTVVASQNEENSPYFSGSFKTGKDTFSGVSFPRGTDIISEESSLKENSEVSDDSYLESIMENFGTKLTDTGHKDSSGNALFSGSLYLLTFDSPVNVLFHIGESGLSAISIDTVDIAFSKEELTQILTNLFGEPVEEGDSSSWTDEKSCAKYVISDDTPDSLFSSETDMLNGGYSLIVTGNSQ